MSSSVNFTYHTEYQSRLPADGGTFFSNETRDAVRGHYKTVWSACLHAASLYLRQEGFSVKLNTQALPPHNNEGEMSENDRFHLLLGMWKLSSFEQLRKTMTCTFVS